MQNAMHSRRLGTHGAIQARHRPTRQPAAPRNHHARLFHGALRPSHLPVRKPGEPGTQELVARYGDRLVSVRYRYDPPKGKRYKTNDI